VDTWKGQQGKQKAGHPGVRRPEQGLLLQQKACVHEGPDKHEAIAEDG